MLRIIFKSDKSSSATMNFLDVPCASWSTGASTLVVVKPDGSVRYYPLLNIESFMEVQSELEAEA